jgi:hypothetical protein
MLRRKPAQTALVGALLMAAGLANAHSIDDVDITYWTGTESKNRAVVIVDWKPENAGNSKAFGYYWPEGESRTGQKMLEDIRDADSRFDFEWESLEGGDIKAFGWDDNDDGDYGDPGDLYESGFGGAPDFEFWHHWRSPGNNGEDWTTDDAFTPATWTLGDGYYWDGWSWTGRANPEPPNVPIKPDGPEVPEPNMLVLMGLGLVAISRRMRRGFQ